MNPFVRMAARAGTSGPSRQYPGLFKRPNSESRLGRVPGSGCRPRSHPRSGLFHHPSARIIGPIFEHVTYRVGAHSTSDDPAAYRPKAESDAWPLGDPVIRLRNHLTLRGVWSEERHRQAEAEILDTVMAAQREAESHSTLHAGGHPSMRDMFEGVYAEMPQHLRRQRQAAGV